MIRLKVTTSGTAVLRYNKKALKRTMRKAGAEVAAAARTLIRAKVGSGRVYRSTGSTTYRPGLPKGPYQASAPGAAPVRLSGELLRGIKVRPFKSGEGVAIRDTTFYALFLEGGAKGGGRRGGKGARNKRGAPVTGRILQPRPFLSTALAAKQASLADRIRASILDDIEFRRQK